MKELIEKATDFLKAKGCTNSQHLFWIPAIMAEFADEYHKTQMEKLNGEIRESEKICLHDWTEYEDASCNAQMRCTICKEVKQI